MDTLAAFKSRSEALNIYSKLKNSGLACTIISTPPRLNIGCGLCINFNGEYRSAIDRIIRKSNAYSFKGYYNK